MPPNPEESFDDFAVFAIPRLRQVAYAWTQDWHHADDAVQGALERVFAAWPRVRTGEAYGYARTTLVRLLISEARRPWRRHEVTTGDPGEHERPATTGAADTDSTGGEVDRADVLAVLATLPTRQRAVVVLRYLEDLSVAETAEVLRCSEGTVKSQTHAARHALRARLGHLPALSDPPDPPAPHGTDLPAQHRRTASTEGAQR